MIMKMSLRSTMQVECILLELSRYAKSLHHFSVHLECTDNVCISKSIYRVFLKHALVEFENSFLHIRRYNKSISNGIDLIGWYS